MIRHGIGLSGANPDYVRNTHVHLNEIGIRDSALAWYCEQLELAGSAP